MSMPLYEYKCGACGAVTEESRPATYRDVSLLCPVCNSEAERIQSVSSFRMPKETPDVFRNSAGETIRRTT